MADQTSYPPPRGDEAALFRDYNAELMRSVADAVGTSTPQVIEDAVACAWTRFLQHQPDRDRKWRGWLFRVAQREAWALEAGNRDHVSLDTHGRPEGRALGRYSMRGPDPYETHFEVETAFEVLDHLPERLRRVALLRALGMRHKDIGELTGDSPTRVGQLVGCANAHIYEVLEERAHASRR
jgi:DNA-directed RNA polymerase specialized sigma24 family protein